MSRKVLVISDEIHAELKKLSKESGFKLNRIIELIIEELKVKLSTLKKDK